MVVLFIVFLSSVNLTCRGMDISMNFGESLGLRENINMASGSFSAEALEDMLYLYFSHPATEGINLAGYWDGRIFEQSARLVEGPDMTVGYSLIGLKALSSFIRNPELNDKVTLKTI